ncbi:hypothetical protein Clacol_009470 [Clathrus columnatus]|uniref:BTB domain-containing protein n=1 Tax=Clathrus columnatus TaxID=1419009 RepID=A0AAV5AKP5_9AGAM|nr:hypothetical protein Clacol_009470 [Clathrus columnatus]
METSLRTPSISDDTDQAATPTEHPVYYSVEEFIVLKVENVLYRILKSVLTGQSDFFKDLFSPQFSSVLIKDNKEGSSNTFPIVLEQVSPIDFDRLLSLIITGSLELNRPVSASWGSEQWISTLYLADRWQMPAVKKLALFFFRSQAEPHVQIKLGKDFDDKSLIRSGLIDICSREEPITETEAMDIGIELAFKCVAIREKLWEMTLKESLHCSSSKVAYTEIAGRYAPEYVKKAFSPGILKVV